MTSPFDEQTGATNMATNSHQKKSKNRHGGLHSSVACRVFSGFAAGRTFFPLNVCRIKSKCEPVCQSRPFDSCPLSNRRLGHTHLIAQRVCARSKQAASGFVLASSRAPFHTTFAGLVETSNSRCSASRNLRGGSIRMAAAQDCACTIVGAGRIGQVDLPTPVEGIAIYMLLLVLIRLVHTAGPSRYGQGSRLH